MVGTVHGVVCMITKSIPLSEPMGGDSSCCIHGEQCKELIDSVDNSEIQFRCPLTVEVGIDVEYDRHISCFEEQAELDA